MTLRVNFWGEPYFHCHLYGGTSKSTLLTAMSEMTKIWGMAWETLQEIKALYRQCNNFLAKIKSDSYTYFANFSSFMLYRTQVRQG
jgi:hypothetical protein